MAWVGLGLHPRRASSRRCSRLAIQRCRSSTTLLALAGDHSGLAFLFAVFVGGVGNLLAFVYVSAVVARTIERGGLGARPRSRARRETLGRLLVARAAGGADRRRACCISVVGIPWAIRQLIRYQVVPQAVALEGRGSGDAARRSSALVRGRWWWTAGVVLP